MNKTFKILPGEYNPHISVPGAPTFNKAGNLSVMYRLANRSVAEFAEVRVTDHNLLNTIRAGAFQEAERLSRISGCQVTIKDMCVHMTLECSIENGIARFTAIVKEGFSIWHKFAITQETIDSLYEGQISTTDGLSIDIFGVRNATIALEEGDVTILTSRETKFEWEYDLHTKKGRVSHATKLLQHIEANVTTSDVKVSGTYLAKKDPSGYSAWVAKEARKILTAKHARVGL